MFNRRPIDAVLRSVLHAADTRGCDEADIVSVRRPLGRPGNAGATTRRALAAGVCGGLLALAPIVSASPRSQSSVDYGLVVPAPPGVDVPPVGRFPDCRSLAARSIRGTDRRNSIVGTPRADLIFAGGGGDIVDGRAGDDCIDLGPGADRGFGGLGDDLILGGAGADRLSGGFGDDRLRGGPDSDRIYGGSGRDRIAGDSGRDALLGGGSGDRIAGGSGRDRIAGGSGNDSLGGGSGGDRLTGGSGNDRLNGGFGTDVLAGGSGNDRINAVDGERGDRISCGPGFDSALGDLGDRFSRDCGPRRRVPIRPPRRSSFPYTVVLVYESRTDQHRD